MGFPCGSAGEESVCKAGDLGSIPGLGRSLAEGKGYLKVMRWSNLLFKYITLAEMQKVGLGGKETQLSARAVCISDAVFLTVL